jgi:hypothetical protein
MSSEQSKDDNNSDGDIKSNKIINEDVRFCRTCSRFLPTSLFPKGPERYVCKTHWKIQIYECTQRKNMQKKQQELEEYSRSIMSIDNLTIRNNTAIADAAITIQKRSFKRKRQPLSKLRSISILVDSKDDARKVFKVGNVQIGIKDVERLVGCNLALRLLPANPLLPLNNSNIIICTKEERKFMTILWKTKCDTQSYDQSLKVFNLRVQPAYVEPYHQWK